MMSPGSVSCPARLWPAYLASRSFRPPVMLAISASAAAWRCAVSGPPTAYQRHMSAIWADPARRAAPDQVSATQSANSTDRNDPSLPGGQLARKARNCDHATVMAKRITYLRHECLTGVLVPVRRRRVGGVRLRPAGWE